MLSNKKKRICIKPESAAVKKIKFMDYPARISVKSQFKN